MTPYSEVHVRAERMGETPATNLTRSGLEGGGAARSLLKTAASSLVTVSTRLLAASGEVATLLNPLLKVRRSHSSDMVVPRVLHGRTSRANRPGRAGGRAVLRGARWEESSAST